MDYNLKKIIYAIGKVAYKLADRRTLSIPATTPTSTYRNLIAVGGFGYSGHSALLDYLAEFDDITLIDRRKEVTFLTDAGGVFTLEEMIETKNKCTMDFAIKAFITEAEEYYRKGWIYTDEYMKLTREFIDKIVALKLQVPTNDLESFFAMNGYCDTFKFIRSVHMIFSGYKNLEDPFITNPNKPSYTYYLKELTKQQYRSLAKEYIQSFLQTINSKPILVMNHLASDNNADFKRKMEYFGDNYKEIMVWRDPRDVYFEICAKNQLWYAHKNIDEYIFTYKSMINDYFSNPHPKRLLVRFEDLVLKYDETTNEIRNHIGLNNVKPTKPFVYFNPELSKKNIGLWKNLKNKEDIRKIESELSEYCYYQ